MKKLLITLLLFFPVHGAWAEIIGLECVNKRDNILTYYVDTNKKIVTDAIGITVGKNLTESVDSFHWQSSAYVDGTMKKISENYKNSTVYIDRISGQMTKTFNRYNKPSFDMLYLCEKKDTKKKF